MRVATQRLDDAGFLSGHRNTAAIYLAGYSVECSLKALLLSTYMISKQRQVVESFRGDKGHSFESLKARYVRRAGTGIPAKLARSFARVNSWSTDLRYDPGMTPLIETLGFLQAAEEILEWVNQRL